MSQDWSGIQQGNSKFKAEIIQVGLEHSLATQFTSFVAVEEKTVVQGGKPVRIEVPVELPQGVSPLAVPGGGEFDRKETLARQYNVGVAGGVVNGVSGGALFGTPAATPPAKVAPNYSTNQTVEVTAEAPLIETTNSQVSPIRDGVHVTKLKGRFSPEVLAIYRCIAPSAADAKNCKPVPAQLNVAVQISAADPAIEQRLTKAGFKIVSGSGTRQLTGTIAPKELTQLALMAEVEKVSLNK
jgi:hypothetical protein